MTFSCEFPAIIFRSDNGVGFSPVYAQKLFGLFQRLHSQTVFQDMDAGLATVRRIAQKHGGQAFQKRRTDGRDLRLHPAQVE